jgi:hypothetical protein
VPIRARCEHGLSRFLSLLLAVAFLAGLLSALARADEFRRLNATDNRVFFVGKDITDEHHTVGYYRQDGVLVLTDFSSGDKLERGHWNIVNKLCNTYKAVTLTKCFQVWRAGDAVGLRLREQEWPPLAYVREPKWR